MGSPIETRNQQDIGNPYKGLKSEASLAGWPAVLDPAVAWDGTKFSRDQYAYRLDNHDIAEVEAALEHFKALGLDGRDAVKENFPLPTLAPVLHALTDELHNGSGFFTLRGLDPSKYTMEDNVVIYLGISSYVGEVRGKQDDGGHIFAHVRNAEYMEATQQARPIRDSNIASTFHNDFFCDILALQTRNCAKSGGDHILASVATVYNELLVTRPDLIPVLAGPDWPFDTRGKITPPDIRPILFHHDGRIIMSLMRDALIGVPSVQRASYLPRLTPLQVEALDVVQRIAQTHQHQLSMRPGDIAFVNNLAVMHAREAFQDSPSQPRYMVRLWLRNEEFAWSLPEKLASAHRRVFGQDAQVEEDWNIVYKPRLRFEIAERMTS